LGPEFSYQSVIGALMYLANRNRPDIAFVVNLLATHNTTPTMHLWNRIKNILRYIQDTTNLGLFFKKNQDPYLIGYINAGYLSDHYNTRS
jgi:hypothetical protein